MKKLYLLIVIIVGFAVQSWGQVKEVPDRNVYLDAVQLRNIYEQWQTGRYEEYAVFTAMDKIFRKYSLDIEYLGRHGLNPFLNQNLLPKRLLTQSGHGENHKENTNSLLSELNLDKLTAATPKTVSWQVYAINGMSDFLAERFSQETMNFGMNKAVKLLEKDNLIRHCFPNTKVYIKRLQDNNGGYYAADIKLLKEIVKSDFENLPLLIIDNDSIFTNPDQRDMLHIGFSIVDYIQTGYNIQEIIDNMDKNSFRLQNKDLQKILSLLEILSVALKNGENAKEIWYYPTLNINSHNSSEVVTAGYFYGILFELTKASGFLLSFDKTAFVQEIQDISKFTKSLNKANKIAKDNDYKFTSFEEYSAYALQIAEAFQSFFTNVQNVSSKQLLRDYDLRKMQTDGYIKLLAAFNGEDYQKVVSTLFFLLYEKDELQKFRNLNFVAELATMEKPEDMKTVIDAYALPLGSSSIKRSSNFNVSLNGYVGLTTGFEIAYGTSKYQTKGNIGLSAPIGISTTYKGNWTLFLSILDLGSMVNVRFNNNTDFYSDLKFEHFLMPGAGLFYNIKNTPFSLGGHYGHIPNLRSIEYSDGNAIIQEHNVSVSRFNLSFLVDIPFFTLFDR